MTSNDTTIGSPQRIIDNATIAAYNSDCKHRIRRASYGRHNQQNHQNPSKTG